MTLLAHAVGARFGDFYAGLLHPVTALEHLLPILGICLLSGCQGPRVARWILLVLPCGLLAGALLDAAVGDQEWTRGVNLVALALVGLCVALAPRLPPWLVPAAAPLLGTAIGLENGIGLPAAVSVVPFALGVAGAGFVVGSLVAAVAVSLRRGRPAIALRVLGSWIAAVGILLVALQLAAA